MSENILKIVGMLGTTEVCRFLLVNNSMLDSNDVLARVWKEYPQLRSENARIYIEGIPLARRFMGQTLVEVGE